jgi:zinc transport system ATP-binding protein
MFATLRTVGAASLMDVPVEGLSGGQMQRILLALALEPQPELLLLDEPAAGIDFRDVQDFYGIIAKVNAETRVTVLLVSHDLPTVASFARQVLCLRDGQIVAKGAPAEVLAPDRVTAVFGTR